MPDVATAPTATAAQTAAAGSRMIGFYLGGGGVKVDCLFDTANFLTRSAAGQYTANGSLVTGSANATTGLVSVGMSYSGEMLGTLGSMRGSGAVAIGFGVKPAPANSNGWVSSLSTGGAWARGGLVLSGTQFSVGFAASQTTAAGTDVALTNIFNVQPSGVGIGRTPGTNVSLDIQAANSDAQVANFRVTQANAAGSQSHAFNIYQNPVTSVTILQSIASPASGGGFSFYCGGAEAVRFAYGGNVGIGTGTPETRLHVRSSSQVARFETTIARGGGSNYLGFYDPTGRKGFFGFGGVADAFVVANEMNEPVAINTNGNNRWMFEAAGNFRPYNDNGYSVGVAANRISVLYAGTGAINTSDERFKVWIGRAAEDRAAKDRRIARAILDELGWYQFTDAVTEKGPDGARWHFGARAQRIWQIVADEGLAPPLVDVEGILLPDNTWTGPVAPAWLCFDGWNDQFEDVYRDVVHVDEVQVGEEGTGEFGPDGAEIMRPVIEEVERIEREPTGEQRLAREAGHLFGFRVDEMNLLLSWALHDRLSALEAAA